MENLRWIAAAALSAYACSLAVRHPTPIDEALPFLATVVTLLAWLAYRSGMDRTESRERDTLASGLMLGVPLLIVAELALPDDATRLLAFGTVMAAAFGIACASLGTGRRGEGAHGDAAFAAVPLAVAALLVLRWIPLANVRAGREIFLLLVVAAIVWVLGRTPFAVVVAVAVGLVTPAVPLRTLALPLAVLLVAAVARLFGMPRLRFVAPASVAIMIPILFFPWSGLVARAFPYVVRRPVEHAPRFVVAHALAPRASVTYEVPEGSRSIVVSGANVAHLRRGALLGRIEPGGIDVRVGDASDWGYLRRDQFYGAHNPLPANPAGKVREYGYAAWLDGAGRIALPRGARTIRVTADAALPPDASLQVEGFE